MNAIAQIEPFSHQLKIILSFNCITIYAIQTENGIVHEQPIDRGAKCSTKFCFQLYRRIRSITIRIMFLESSYACAVLLAVLFVIGDFDLVLCK